MNININDTCEAVCELLRLTNDGNLLAPKHMYLVQLVVNGHASEEGEREFYKILDEARAGKYDAGKVWFYGIENLTKDQIGYVYWKGISFEHFSYRNGREEHIAAIQYSQRCLTLNAKGIEANNETVWGRVEKYLTPEEIAACKIVLQVGDDESDITGVLEFIKVNTAPDVYQITKQDIQNVLGLGVGQAIGIGMQMVKRIA